MRFGSIDLPCPVSAGEKLNPRLLYGAWVAGETFYDALLQYGTFDEYHFFVKPTHISQINKRLSVGALRSNRVKIIDRRYLPLHLQKEKYTVFFSTRPFLSQLAHLRGQWADQYFPVCGMGFTISYPQMLEDVAFHNMIADLYPFDSMICISTSQRKAIQNLYRTVAHACEKEFQRVPRYKGRLDGLPLGVHGSEFGKKSREEARKQLGISSEPIVLLYFGRFSNYDKMDLHPLLIAFQKISKEEQEVRLILAGSDAQGRYGQRVKKLAQEMNLTAKIELYPNPSLSHKYLLYSASDVFVSPSDNIQEAFGLTILEAMASGLPVVASDWNGYKDIIVHRETGFRVPTYWANCTREVSASSRFTQSWESDHLLLAQSVCVDVEKMTEYLLTLVRNGDLRDQLGQNGKNRVQKEFDWQVLIPRYEKLWKNLHQASQTYKIKKRKVDLFAPHYFECFRHYPTRILNGQTTLAITEEGALFLRTRKPPEIPGALNRKISVGIIFILLTIIGDQKFASIEHVRREAQKYFKMATSDHLLYHIMWLLKKNLVRMRNTP